MSKMKSLRLAVVVLGLIVVGAGQAGAGVVFQDDFNSENGGVGALNYAGFNNFNVSGGTVDLIGNGLFDVYPGNGLYVDLTGTGTAGRFETKLLFAPGLYELTFDIGNNPNVPPVDVNSVVITLGNTSHTYTRIGSVPLQRVTDVYSVITASTLVFQGEPNPDPDDSGIIIDNVVVSTVPEPSTLATAGVALLLWLGQVRRRRSASA